MKFVAWQQLIHNNSPRGHSTTTWTEFCHFLTPPPLRGLFMPWAWKKQTFLTPSSPYIVHVVIECPLMMHKTIFELIKNLTGTTLKVTHMTGKIGNLRNSQNFYPFSIFKYLWQRHLLDVKTLYYHLTYGIRHTLHAILAKTLFYRRLGFQIWNCGAGGFQFNFGNGNSSWTRWEQTLLFGIMVSLRFMLA